MEVEVDEELELVDVVEVEVEELDVVEVEVELRATYFQAELI